MAHLWIEQQPGEWALFPLESKYHVLALDPLTPVRAMPIFDPVRVGVLLGRFGNGPTGELWILKCASSMNARVNAQPVRLGMRVLKDQDEIVLGGRRQFFFSTETLAHVEAFPG